MKYLLDRGYDIEGIDFSTYKVFEETDLDIPIYNGDFSQSLSIDKLKESYDVVLLVNIIHEHFSYISDLEEYYIKSFSLIYSKLNHS